MVDLLGLNTLMAELILALGLALLLGNVFAWVQHRRGARPPEAEGEFRAVRVAFLSVVGLVMATWGVASLVT